MINEHAPALRPPELQHCATEILATVALMKWSIAQDIKRRTKELMIDQERVLPVSHYLEGEHSHPQGGHKGIQGQQQLDGPPGRRYSRSQQGCQHTRLLGC